jgi:hypothetical protein
VEERIEPEALAILTALPDWIEKGDISPLKAEPAKSQKNLRRPTGPGQRDGFWPTTPPPSTISRLDAARAAGRGMSLGGAAMMKNAVAGCVVVALIFMGYLAFYQKHEGCWRGHSIKDPREHCGSLDMAP